MDSLIGEIQIFQHRGNFDSYDSAEIFMVSASTDDFNHTDVLSSIGELKKKESFGVVSFVCPFWRTHCVEGVQFRYKEPNIKSLNIYN